MKLLRRKKTIFILLVLILVGGVFFSKVYLYVSFLLGNDIIVKLDVDKEFLDLKHGDSEKVNFKASVTTNPFCKAVCTSEFLDINDSRVIGKDEFVLKPGFSFERYFIVKAPDNGRGISLYRFSMECKSVGSALCHTGEESTTRDVLVSANYSYNEEEEDLRKDLKKNILELAGNITDLRGKYLSLQQNIKELNKSVELGNYNLSELEEGLDSMEYDLVKFVNLWELDDFYSINDENNKLSAKILKFGNRLEDLGEETSSGNRRYNELVDILKNIKINLEGLRFNVSAEFSIEINNTIHEFREVMVRFSGRSKMDAKRSLVDSISNKTALLLENRIDGTITIDEEIIFDLNKINTEDINIENISVELNDSDPMCCVFGNCQRCCVSDKCGDVNFPIIFLHGHAISESLSAEYSLEGFNKLQEKMEEDGFLNAGTITLYTPKETSGNILGQFDVPVTFRASYYFDIFREPENYVVVQRKSENIDTYAVRLKELVDSVKIQTGKKKINVIAFSMGGLVARRYVQIFGGGDINKLILLGTPNNGIKGDVKRLCGIVGGGKLECENMAFDSLFINKLNNGKAPLAEIHNIYGTGCSMLNGRGDGVVLEESAKLENVENYVIKGKCVNIRKLLHLDLLKPDLYPEVYEIIREILNF